MAKPYGEETHTQQSVVVYTTKKEKEDIKKAAVYCKKSMSKYLLDLHINSKTMKKIKNSSLKRRLLW